MRIVCISDTHGQHDRLRLPKGDVLIHAGDFTKYGSRWDAIDFSQWLKTLDYKYVVVIAGNHDFYAQADAEELKELLWRNGKAFYLQDSGVEIDGIRFYGSPWTPKFFDWAFMKDRGKSLSAIWDKIPDTTQVLITHGPPRTILDIAQSEPHAGCDDLAKKVSELPNLKLHVFGHLHEGFGQEKFNGVQFVNAAQLDDNYNLTHWPIVVEL